MARRTNKPAHKPSSAARQRSQWPYLALLLLVVAGVVYGASRLGSDTSGHQTKPAAQSAANTPGSKAIPAVTSDPALDQLIAAWQKQYSFDSSVVVQELTGSNRSSAKDATASVVPASTYKIYVAYAILHGIEQGKYTMATVTQDGSTVQADLTAMIINSDNDAARTLGFLYGWQDIDTLLKEQGATATNLYNYVPPSTDPVGDKHTTAADLATILRKLYGGSLLNQTDTQFLLGLMEKQNYRERIPSGVPSGITVADKPGWLTAADGDNGTIVQNDAAIVYGPKSTYILVITTTGTTTQPLADLSQQVYDHLEQ